MVLEAPTMYPEVREVVTAPGKGLHGYYRKADGWLSVASTTPSNRGHYEEKGFTFLAQYGQFANGTFHGVAKERDARGVPWNPADEPWRLLFQKGGAKEFPADQIIAYRWHIRPPYREAIFPQLKGVDITDLPCPECDMFVASSQRPQEATRMLKTHLMSKTNERHAYTIADLRELGKEWDLDFETSRTRHVPKEVARKSLEAEEPIPIMEQGEAKLNLDHQCKCGWAPPITSKRPDMALKFHARRCQHA